MLNTQDKGSNVDKMIADGLLGIIAGILTSALLLVVKTLWDKWAVPFFREIRYSGVQVAGTWTGENPDPVEGNKLRLFLTQSAHDLAGDMTLTLTGGGNVRALDFVVSGYMWEGFLTLNLKPKDRKVTSYATMLVKLHDGGHELIGKMAFRNVQTDAVETTQLRMFRSDSK